MRFITINYGVELWAYQNHIQVSTQKQNITQSIMNINTDISVSSLALHSLRENYQEESWEPEGKGYF